MYNEQFHRARDCIMWRHGPNTSNLCCILMQILFFCNCRGYINRINNTSRILEMRTWHEVKDPSFYHVRFQQPARKRHWNCIFWLNKAIDLIMVNFIFLLLVVTNDYILLVVSSKRFSSVAICYAGLELTKCFSFWHLIKSLPTIVSVMLPKTIWTDVVDCNKCSY